MLHIDVDEALCFGFPGSTCCSAGLTDLADAEHAIEYFPSSPEYFAVEYFASLPHELDEAVFINHEAAPETAKVEDWFKEVRVAPSA
jgi:hypothetical protein